jgi:hypothetical protein
MTPHTRAAAAAEMSKSRSGGVGACLRILATGLDLLHSSGSGALSLGLGRRRLVLRVALATALAFVVGVSPALAARPKQGGSGCRGVNHTALIADSTISPEKLETHWTFAYSTTAGGPWTSFGSGTITQVQAAGNTLQVEAELPNLTPEVPYYILFTATNSDGTISTNIFSEGSPRSPFCETIPLHSQPRQEAPRNVTGTSAYASGFVQTRGFATHWRFEDATSEAGPWTPVAGGEGTITQAEAEAEPSGGPYSQVDVRLTGLSPGTLYYVRLAAESEPEWPEGSGKRRHLAAASPAEGFETAGAPTVATFAVHAIHDEALRAFGAIDPRNVPTSAEQTITIGGAPTGGSFTLEFEGQRTVPIAFDASANVGTGSVQQALHALPKAPEVNVSGPAGGPYTVYFTGASGGVAQPRIVADASGLTPSGTVTAATTQEGGVAYDTHYHFEYVDQEQFASTGWAGAQNTSEVALGAGTSHVESGFSEGRGTLLVYDTKLVGGDIPGLRPGGTYVYRLVATSTAPGDPVVRGAEQTLTVPAVSTGGEGTPAACPNEALRSGLSAHLPDCRAYEQITPVDKEGAFEIFKYATALNGGMAFGEDGEHLMVAANATHWGAGAEAGQGPYFFSRTPSGWRMTAGSPEPEAGIDRYEARIFSSDLTQFGLLASWNTSPESQSPDVELKAGPPGGPYAKISVPSSQAGGGLVGASEDLGKLIVSVEDHTLLGHATGTTSGDDLYEWSSGQLRQVNVLTSGQIGSCGAKIADGEEGHGVLSGSRYSSLFAVSTDGSRVFFEAVPGGDCSAPSHLYMRVNGSETVDLGPYEFLAANAAGTRVLLQRQDGQADEVFLYDTASATAKALFTVPGGISLNKLRVSEDLTAIYFESEEQLTPEAPAISPETGAFSEDLYRYDISTEKLHFLVQISDGRLPEVSPDGRYYYFSARAVAALPAGRPGIVGYPVQLYRYDSSEDIIECVSCASPFDPEPNYEAETSDVPGGSIETFVRSADDRPQVTLTSANGDYAVFETASALVPQDVNGEIAPGRIENGEFSEYPGGSPSDDVYEWRREGLDGCTHIQGCLSLITPGTEDGLQVVVLGIDASARDIFFYTHSQLVPQDNDTAGDIYDARIDGGIPTPSRPVECEGDTCASPESAPNDATPSSFTFSGVGNFAQPSTARPGGGSRESGKSTAKKRGSKKKSGKKKSRKKKPSRASKGRGHARKSSGRSR